MGEKAHLGRYFLETMRNRDPEEICMIDAGTGEESTVHTILRRSIQLARCFGRLGLQPGDVLILAGINHNNLRLPYYAAMMTGLPIAGVDPLFKYHEIKFLLGITKAKIVFCQIESYEIYKQVTDELGIGTKIVTFGGAETSLDAFIAEYDSGGDVDDFKATDFDSHSVYAWLVSTSGTTGVPKLAVFTHRHLIENSRAWMEIQGVTKENARHKRVLIASPAQWLSGFVQYYATLVIGACVIHTSKPDSTEHLIDIINKYKPTSVLGGPAPHALILKQEKKYNYECFDVITLGGSKVHTELILGLKAVMRKDAMVKEMYGQTEMGNLVLLSTADTPIGGCRPIKEDKDHAIKLVDVNTGEEIKEPYKNGELWWNGPQFDEYYNNPEETARAIVNGWLRSGDVFYFDEQGNYFFVERFKMLIKYRNFVIPPPELEEVILTHPGVKLVAVTRIPHETDGEHPVACIVRHPEVSVTADEIKNLVASKLTTTKQLRGGVIFMDSLPATSTGKVSRKELEDLVKTLKRE